MASFHPEKLAELTGLTYDKSESILRGTLHGYPVFVKWISMRNTLVFRLIAKPAAGAELADTLERWRTDKAGISNLMCGSNNLSCLISLAPSQREQRAAEHIEALVSFAEEQQLIPCCVGCGTEYGYAPYLLDGSAVTLCDACKATVERNMADMREKAAQKPANLTGHVLGALLGGAILFVMTYFVLKIGYVVYLVGYLGALITFLLMKKFGKKLTLGAALFGIAVCLAVAFITPIYSFAGEMAAYNASNTETAQSICDYYNVVQSALNKMDADKRAEAETGEGMQELKSQYAAATLALKNQTTLQCIKNMSALLDSEIYEDVRGELIKCILWGVISILIGSLLTLPKMISESSGKHTLRALPV